jgi:hypothetical protein
MTSDGFDDCPTIERSVSLSASGQLYVVTIREDFIIAITVRYHVWINKDHPNPLKVAKGLGLKAHGENE